MTFIIIIFLTSLWSILVLCFIGVVFIVMTNWRDFFESMVCGLIILGLVLPAIYAVINAYVAFQAITSGAAI